MLNKAQGHPITGHEYKGLDYSSTLSLTWKLVVGGYSHAPAA